MLSNRKRNIPLYIHKEYSQERSKKKMADFKNHRRFTLRCLDSNIIPVSLRLKSNIRTPRAISIIKKTERALFNERIRTINSTIEMLECQCHTCRSELNKVLDQETMAECDKIMVKIKEDQHHKTLMRQKAKLDRLMRKEEPVNKGGCSHPNMPRYMYHSSKNTYMYQSSTDSLSTTASTTPDNGTTSEDPTTNSRSTTTTSTAVKSKSKWVINMLKKPLTELQVKLLAHGPNYVVAPRNPPIGEYITAVEKTCQNLTQGEADEMRAEIKAAIKRSHPPRPNITRAEQKALRELKKDDTRVILTADKGVCLVVLDKDEYIRKAEELLKEKTYKIVPTDPTNRQKNRLIQILKKIKEEGGMIETTSRKFTQQVLVFQSFMDYQRSTRLGYH